MDTKDAQKIEFKCKNCGQEHSMYIIINKKRGDDWSDEKIKKVMKMYKDGKSYGEIAEKIGSTKSAIQHIIMRNK